MPEKRLCQPLRHATRQSRRDIPSYFWHTTTANEYVTCPAAPHAAPLRDICLVVKEDSHSYTALPVDVKLRNAITVTSLWVVVTMAPPLPCRQWPVAGQRGSARGALSSADGS